MEIPHANLSEVPGMVLVDVRPVMVLSTSHTTTTGMLAVLAHSAVAGGDMTPAVVKVEVSDCLCMLPRQRESVNGVRWLLTACAF